MLSFDIAATNLDSTGQNSYFILNSCGLRPKLIKLLLHLLHLRFPSCTCANLYTKFFYYFRLPEKICYHILDCKA